MKKKIILSVGSLLAIGVVAGVSVINLTSCGFSNIKYVMHRGLSSRHFENTKESFEAAGKLNSTWGIETDIYLTKTDASPISPLSSHPLVCAHGVNPFRQVDKTERDAGWTNRPEQNAYHAGECNPSPSAYDPLWDPYYFATAPGSGGYRITDNTYAAIKDKKLWTGYCGYSPIDGGGQYEVMSNDHNAYGIKGNYTVPLFSDYLKICKEYNKEAVIEIKDENAFWGSDYASTLMNELLADAIAVGWVDHCTIITFDGAIFDPTKDPLALPFYSALRTISEGSPNQTQSAAKKMLTKFQKLIWSDYDHDVPSAEAYWAIGKGLNVDVDKSVLLAPGGKDIIKFAHENDLIVNTWTVNDETERDQLIKLGVDQVSTNCTF